MSFKIVGTGSALPKTVITNDDLATFLDTSDEWISTRTGIRERRVLNGETLTDLAVLAGQRALENAGVAAEDLDYILCATLNGEYVAPPLACLVQAALGASCPAVDIGGACSGFLYALDMAAGVMARGAENVLVLGADALSHFADWSDRATCVLFGDGAGAAVLQKGDNLQYLKVSSEGEVGILYVPASGSDMPKEQAPHRKSRGKPVLRMQGSEVYKFAVRAIDQGMEEALAATGLRADEIDHVLLHQANLRIVEAARKKMGIPAERCHVNIDHVGNMSAASIPVLLDECNQKGAFKRGDILVMSAFGSGLTTGTAVLRW